MSSFLNQSERRRCRPMPVRKAHEPRQASRGGLNGSDGSGRTLLAVRKEIRRRSGELRKNGRNLLRHSDWALTVYHPGEGTKGRANIAPVGLAGAGMVVDTAGVIDMLVCSRLTSLVRMTLRKGLRLASQLKHMLGAHTGGRAHHCSCQRAPKREQHRQKYEEPDAKRFHEY